MKKLKCLKCRHEWYPRSPKRPGVCPKCKRKNWDTVSEMKNDITQKELKRQLHYDPVTGIFTRKVSNTNCVKIGDVAGSKNCQGYIDIWINNKPYRAHRLAWLYMYGYWPENTIDHKDNNPKHKHHNWISNLREASYQCQQRNQKNGKNNTSGIKGVCWSNKTKRWRVVIGINKKQHYLGVFKTFDEAVCHRLAAEQCLGWGNCDSNSSAYQYIKENIIETNSKE